MPCSANRSKTLARRFARRRAAASSASSSSPLPLLSSLSSSLDELPLLSSPLSLPLASAPASSSSADMLSCSSSRPAMTTSSFSSLDGSSSPYLRRNAEKGPASASTDVTVTCCTAVCTTPTMSSRCCRATAASDHAPTLSAFTAALRSATNRLFTPGNKDDAGNLVTSALMTPATPRFLVPRRTHSSRIAATCGLPSSGPSRSTQAPMARSDADAAAA
mmetsp:Transcript_9661/g.30642  ORF Transcript_9661/g.30642 Transcript_9661/m.30642 type:complete len:219 (-) Transcript_9661:812-1468(-)